MHMYGILKFTTSIIIILDLFCSIVSNLFIYKCPVSSVHELSQSKEFQLIKEIYAWKCSSSRGRVKWCNEAGRGDIQQAKADDDVKLVRWILVTHPSGGVPYFFLKVARGSFQGPCHVFTWQTCTWFVMLKILALFGSFIFVSSI